MARINSNIPSLVAAKNLATANADLEVRLTRLATGLRINRGGDDPAGLIISERLRSELSGIEQGIRNSERASNVIATAEGALTEVSNLLNDLRALVVEAANTGAFSPDEIEANQLQIDSAIDSITRIANSASFGGLKLLNGSLGYTTSGIDTSNLVKTKVFGVDFGDRDSVNVDVETVTSAQQANVFIQTDFSNINGAWTDGVLPSTVTIEIAGPLGAQELTFLSGTDTQDIISGINNLASVTGVRAEFNNADGGGDATSGVRLFSVEYGTESIVTVEERTNTSAVSLFIQPPGATTNFVDFTDGTTFDEGRTDRGQDVAVVVNGNLATGRGLEVSSRVPTLDVQFLLDETFATNVTGTPESFVITGGGSKFQLGPSVNAQQQVNIGLDSISATRIGGSFVTLGDGVTQELQFLSSIKSGGANALKDGNLANASEIIETAIEEIASLRGRLGAFEANVLDTNIRSLQAGVENITSAESVIRDADFATETAELTRSQVLSQAATSALATANANASSVLSLLG
ncbi:MAG: flagellin [Planctomycetota bacterium]